MGGKDLTKKMNGPYFGIPKKYDLKIGLKFMWNEPKNFKLKKKKKKKKCKNGFGTNFGVHTLQPKNF